MGKFQIYQDGRAAGANPISGSDFVTKDYLESHSVELDPVYKADSGSLKASASLASASSAWITLNSGSLAVSMSYDSDQKKIKLFSSGSTVVAEIDATDFIKDGMVNTITLDTGSLDLTITFNTDAGKEDIVVPMRNVFDLTMFYTKDETYNKEEINTTVSTLVQNSQTGSWTSASAWLGANSASLKASASLAHSHSNAALLNSLTNAKTGSWDAKESTDNKVTEISSTSTNTEYPSAKAVQDKITGLSGSATIASSTDGVVVIKRGILQTAGVVGNNADTDITLHKIATSGNPSDIIVVYDGTTTNLQAVLNQIKSDIDRAEASGTEYIVCNNVASEIPEGFQYYNGVTGTLAASAQTAGKIYLVKNGTASYNQVTTTLKNGVYSWTNLGSTVVDLSGVIKTITVNGKAYGASGGSMIDIGDVITSVTAQAEINNSNKALVHVVATTGEADSTTGTKAVALEAQAKTATVASGETGLAIASDVKDYVDNRVVFRTWTAS